MDDLPELPFEKVLSYLSLEDRLKVRAVSRRWYHTINRFKVKTLCYSEIPDGFIFGKGRWVNGAFGQNFISSTRFSSFFNTFGHSILSNLKHLRLCDLDLGLENGTAFTQTLSSLGQLEELDIIRFNHVPSNPKRKLELSLPMLNSLQLEHLTGIECLTLDAPRLKNVNLWNFSSSLRLDLVQAQSVERLVTWDTKCIAAKNWTNLLYLYTGDAPVIHATFLAGLKQLKEIHLNDRASVSELFEQKRRYARFDLKIFFFGFLLNCAEDLAKVSKFDHQRDETFSYLVENYRRLADAIPLYRRLHYTAIENVAPELQTAIFSRFHNLNGVSVPKPVEDIHRFLGFLKSFENIVDLHFWCDQPQDLFNRLPEHCAVQHLTIHAEISDLRFLLRLKHLIYLHIGSIDAELIARILDELHFLSWFEFKFANKKIEIEVCHFRRFKISVDEKEWNVPDLNSAIEFLKSLSSSQSE